MIALLGATEMICEKQVLLLACIHFELLSIISLDLLSSAVSELLLTDTKSTH